MSKEKVVKWMNIFYIKTSRVQNLKNQNIENLSFYNLNKIN